MASQLISLAGWYFLPNLVTGYAQATLYAIFVRAGDPKPAPGTPRYARDRRNIHIAVILLYLLYTIYEADYQLLQAGDFYRILGVSPHATEKEIQSRFRRLTVQYHPDKATGSDRAQIEALFVQLQVARDTLIDPAKRFAYDRLGPDVLTWQSCKLTRDYIITGLQQLTMYFLGSGLIFILLGVLGYFRTGTFWRYLFMSALCLFELHTITRPTFPLLLTKVINPIVTTTRIRNAYLPFQLITLLRKISITIFIAIQQLCPLFQPHTHAAKGHAASICPHQLDRIDMLAQATETEVSRLLSLELMPFAGDVSALRELKDSLKEWLVRNTVQNDAAVQRAMNEVLERRRKEGRLEQGGR